MGHRERFPYPLSLKKHLEGWQLAVVTITIAWGTAVLVVPRAVPPEGLPRPWVDPSEAEAVLARDAALSRSVIVDRPDGHVRRLGSAVRAYGLKEAKEDQKGQNEAKVEIDAAARGVPNTEEVLRLRAYQTETFLAAIRTWQATGRAPADLDALGGGFRGLLRDNDWVHPDGPRWEVVPDPLVLRAMFKKRWNELVGAGSDAFSLAPVEARALAGFLLAHPPLPKGAAGSGVSASAYQDQMRLKKIADIEKMDTTYPATYARGIVFYRLGSYQAAVQSFGRYLESTPSGPYALRAGNYLRASLDHAEIQ